MSPADMRKEGSAYDLTLAVGILAASNQIKAPDWSATSSWENCLLMVV